MTLAYLLKTMRPRQWFKNAVVFAALVFDVKLFVPLYLARTALAFTLLCMLTSAVYILNDLADIEKDRQHPAKRNRPLAAGKLSKRLAIVAATVLLAFALSGAAALDLTIGSAPAFTLLFLLYLLNNLLYTFWLKNVVILDVLLIAAGFVIRVGAGTLLVDVERFSPWLYVCMTLLALFFGLGKRRAELVLVGEQAPTTTRAVLNHYTIALIDHLIAIVATSTIVAYSFYTFTALNLPSNHTMMLTIPFVLYGIFRYLYLIHVQGEGGAPDELVLKDRPLMATFLLWGIAAVAFLYFG